jgi:heterodisulfide reductase subunit C
MVTPNPDFVSELAAAGGENAKMCFQCGTCTAGCPSGKNTAYRTRKLMRMAQLGLKDMIIDSEDLWQCTTCYTCEERCPRGVPIVDVVIALRNIAVANGKMYDAHKKTADNLVKFGHTVSINDKVKAQRAELGLPEVPPTVLANEKAKADLDAIFEATGFGKLIG